MPDSMILAREERSRGEQIASEWWGEEGRTLASLAKRIDTELAGLAARVTALSVEGHEARAGCDRMARVAAGLWALISGPMEERGEVGPWEAHEAALKLGLIALHPEPYDPARHGDVADAAPGDPWYTLTDLARSLATRHRVA